MRLRTANKVKQLFYEFGKRDPFRCYKCSTLQNALGLSLDRPFLPLNNGTKMRKFYQFVKWVEGPIGVVVAQNLVRAMRLAGVKRVSREALMDAICVSIHHDAILQAREIMNEPF